MKNDDLAKAWFAKAENDIKAAEIILESEKENIPTDTICFHSQQAVEKYLKGFLVLNEISFPFTHNLKDLVEKAKVIDNSFSTIIVKAEMLSPYAVEIRYPDDYFVPSIAEAKEAFEIAIEIKAFIQE